MVIGFRPNNNLCAYSSPVDRLQIGDLYSASLDGGDDIFVLLAKGGSSIGSTCIISVNNSRIYRNCKEQEFNGKVIHYSLDGQALRYHVGSMLPSELARELVDYRESKAAYDTFEMRKFEEAKAVRSNGNSLRHSPEPTPALSAP